MLSIHGYRLRKSDVNVDEILSKLTVKPNDTFIQAQSEDTEFCVCLQSNKYLFVPKYFGLTNYGLPITSTLTEYSAIEVPFMGSLLENQKSPVEKFIHAAKDPLKMGGILQLPPGFGKTVIALYIISQLKAKTIIVVHKEFLMNQWKERIQQYLPNASVGTIKQNILDIDCDIVIASLQSICMRNYEQSHFSSFGFLIVDECHHIGAQVFCRALTKLNFMFTLGLSATPNRKDGLSKVFKWFMGDVVFKISKKASILTHVLIAPFSSASEKYTREFTIFNGKPNYSKMINNKCEFEERTRFIAEVLNHILSKEPTRNIIILSDRRQHLNDINEQLLDLNNGLESKTGFYVGNMKNDKLVESSTKQIILGTYNMVSEGFDLPKLDTLILATSKSDVEQSVGRIQRKHEYTDQDNIPLVVDIVDKLPLFERQAKRRQTFYNKMGYTCMKYNNDIH